jgi:predicted dinucleotide-binding enzyme
MAYKSFVSLSIAIIGEGIVSESMAQVLAKAGHEIYLGLGEGQNVSDSLLDKFENIHACTIGLASSEADIIIIATPAEDVREVAYKLEDVRKKIIIGATGNVHPKPVEFVPTVNALRSITGSEHVVKCFNCAGYDNILSRSFRKQEVDMFVAGDSKKAKEMVKLLAKDMGFANCYDFGDNDTVPLLEDMAKCWYNLAITQKLGQKISFKLIRG